MMQRREEMESANPPTLESRDEKEMDIGKRK